MGGRWDRRWWLKEARFEMLREEMGTWVVAGVLVPSIETIGGRFRSRTFSKFRLVRMGKRVDQM